MTSDSFSKYLDENTRFWASLRGPEASKDSEIILVDLCHNWPEYIIHALLVAKSLQRILGSVIKGLYYETGVVTRACSGIDFRVVESIAKSFGVTDIVAILRKDFESSIDSAYGRDSFSNENIRCDFGKQGFLDTQDGTIDRCIYESTLRENLWPSARYPDRELFNSATETNLVAESLENVFRESRVKSVVVGHIDYNPWRLICDAANRRNIEIYYFFLREKRAVWKLKPNPSELIGALRRRATETTFKWLEDRSAKIQNIIQHNYLRIHSAGEPSVALANDPRLRSFFRTNARERLGVDAKTPLICLFAHAVSDTPLQDEQAYFDYEEWLTEILEIALSDESKVWVIKVHPLDVLYDQTALIKRMQERYKKPNIIFVRDEFSKVEILIAADLVLTVRGSIAFEAVAAGVHCITAGFGAYSNCGFAQAYLSKKDFEQALTTTVVSGTISDNQQNKARLYCLLDQQIGNVPSTATPPIGSYFHDDRFFENARQKLLEYNPESDPFFHAILQLHKLEYGRAIDPIWEAFLNDRAAGPARRSGRVHGKISVFSFAERSVDSGHLVSGFDKAEEAGIWSNKIDAVFLARIENPSNLLSRKFRIFGQKLSERQVVTVEVNGEQSGPIPISHTNLNPTEFVSPKGSERSDGVVCLKFTTSRLFSPHELGINEDRRSLGFFITRLEIE